MSDLQKLTEWSDRAQAQREAIVAFSEMVRYSIKPKDRVYFDADVRLITGSLDDTYRYMIHDYRDIRYRNHEKKGEKLVSCEAYFV